MQRTTLAILWHMHQPYYRDMVTGESTMPWARLHGIHSYYDMLRLYEKFPKINGTINFVPSLIEQLLAYIEDGKSDTFLEHTLIPAEQLTPLQKTFLLRYFFMANPERKIFPYPAYRKLYERRGVDFAHIDFQQAIRFFSTQDYLDIQVLYNLTWFGFAAREEIPEIDELLLRGSHFTEDNKKFVIDTQMRIIKNLLDAIRRASVSQNVEICTTPYYHPIFPLLLDTNFALRCMPRTALPAPMKLQGVAEHQLLNGLDKMERWTGRRPQGMWPAEGSVCPEMIPILANAGIKWIASDDRVLARSLARADQGTSHHQHFMAAFDGSEVGIVFRDHGISDLLSFTYSKMPAKMAIDDFLTILKRIDADSTKREEKLVTVILDGENAWEFYPESGKEFLTGLFATLEKENIPTTTIGSYFQKKTPAATIDKLYTASWIDANFRIWIGKPQKNQAWGYIKRVFDELGSDFTPEKREQNHEAQIAYESFCAACGSDWFWWFDDDFNSAFKADFDRLFRQHLKNAYMILGRDVPLFLFEPIFKFTEGDGKMAEPAGFMTPSIDGLRTSFFEWANALRFNVRGRGGAIALSAEPFETILFGFNTEAFFLRFDPAGSEPGMNLEEGDEVVFYLHDGDKHSKFSIGKYPEGFKLKAPGIGEESDSTVSALRWSVRQVMEVAVSFASLGYKPGEKMTVAIALHRRGVEIRRYSHIHFLVPDDTYEQRMWSV